MTAFSPAPGVQDPRTQLQGAVWPLALLLPVCSAVLQMASGFTVNMIHSGAFLLMVLLALGLERQPGRPGRALFLLALPLFLVWLVGSPGVGPAFLPGFLGYTAVLILPVALAAVWFRLEGMLLFVLYALALGALSFPLPHEQSVGVVWNTLLSLTAGGVLAWLLDAADRTMAQLRESALVDVLTGLGNRRAFEVSLGSAWAMNPGRVGVALLDVDGLKNVNDSRGHEAGDALLRAVAAALRREMDSGGSVYRLGGDEYVILCRPEQLPGLPRRVASALAEVRLEGVPTVTASLGVASGVRPTRRKASSRSPTCGCTGRSGAAAEPGRGTPLRERARQLQRAAPVLRGDRDGGTALSQPLVLKAALLLAVKLP